MLDPEALMSEIAGISRKIKSSELPALTVAEKQAAVALAALEKTVIRLLEVGMPHKMIFMSLFFFWLTLEAPMRGISQRQLDRCAMFPETAFAIIEVVKAKTNVLPDYQPTKEMKALGGKINALKSLVPDEDIDRELPHDELVYCSNQVNTLIHTVTSYLLMESFHPEIISNVMFGYWLRLSTLHAGVSEEFYQKIEHYFNEVHQAVREHLPLLFKA
jgi:hypothetical protein